MLSPSSPIHCFTLSLWVSFLALLSGCQLLATYNSSDFQVDAATDLSSEYDTLSIDSGPSSESAPVLDLDIRDIKTFDAINDQDMFASDSEIFDQGQDFTKDLTIDLPGLDLSVDSGDLSNDIPINLDSIASIDATIIPDLGITQDAILSDIGVPDINTPDIPIVTPDAPVDAPTLDILADSCDPTNLGPDDLGPYEGGICHPDGGYCNIPSGSFCMGSPDAEPCRNSTNEDYHHVRLTHQFQMPLSEFTKGEAKALVASSQCQTKNCDPNLKIQSIINKANQACYSPSDPDKCPLAPVSWHEAAYICNALSIKDGLNTCYTCVDSNCDGTPMPVCSFRQASGSSIYECAGYRLPTEAEWEYAYRAGTFLAYYNSTNAPHECRGIDLFAHPIAWYLGNSVPSGSLNHVQHEVKTKTPNSWDHAIITVPIGLYDMAGNVAEWVDDFYKENLFNEVDPWVNTPTSSGSQNIKIVRGGHYESYPESLRAAARKPYDFCKRSDIDTDPSIGAFGFRCVRTLP